MIKEPCPSCRSKGQDSAGDNLIKYANGTAHCFACGYHEGGDVVAKANVSTGTLYLPPSTQIPLVNSDTTAYFATTSDGWSTYFHYFNEAGELTGVKSRNYYYESQGYSKKDTIRYSGELEIGGLNGLQYTSELVIVEGESDGQYMWQALGGTYDVLWLPGANTAKLLENHTELVNRYSRVFVFADNDVAGNRLRQDVYKYIADWLTYEAFYPKQANDARDCTASELIDAILGAKPHSVSTKVIDGEAAHRQALVDNSANTRLIKAFNTLPSFNRLLAGGLHAGDFIGLLGNSGKGKSTLLYQIAAECISSAVNVLFVTNEESADYVSATLSSIVDVNKVYAHLTVAETQDFNALLALLHKYATDCVIIDVINAVAPDFLEPIATGSYMRQLLQFANNSGVGVIASCHTTANNEQFKPLPLKLSDAASGRALQRALNGVIAFSAGIDNIPETSRYLTLAKPLRHRRVTDTTPGIIHYHAETNTYFEYAAKR